MNVKFDRAEQEALFRANHPRARNLLGQGFGRLVVVGYAGKSDTAVLWRCNCDCGQETSVISSSLLKGDTRSCKCLQSEERVKNGMANASHGCSHKAQNSSRVMNKTYSVWNAMKNRCSNKKHPSFHRYGGRGISYDPRWEDFESFLGDMGWAPEGLSIDRIDNNGNYCKENCRWTTPAQQIRNSSIAKLTVELVASIRADNRPQIDIAEDYGISSSNVSRIKSGETWK